MLPWTHVSHPNGISIGSAVFAGLMNVTTHTHTHTHTNQPRYSVCNSNRPLSLANSAKWFNNNTNNMIMMMTMMMI